MRRYFLRKPTGQCPKFDTCCQAGFLTYQASLKIVHIGLDRSKKSGLFSILLISSFIIEQLGHKWWSNFLFNLNSVPERVFFSKGRYLHAVRGVAEQASEGDGVGDRAQVDEEDGGEGLDVQPVVEVAGEERQLALDVQDEAAAEPGGGAAS